ncbi:hypothetical protein NC651_034294 [Populus alba x Populus x berolinensis]|nr:hypothetical protein NC651_034294 [Populus alba x Populus x berolinensis]
MSHHNTYQPQEHIHHQASRRILLFLHHHNFPVHHRASRRILQLHHLQLKKRDINVGVVMGVVAASASIVGVTVCGVFASASPIYFFDERDSSLLKSHLWESL